MADLNAIADQLSSLTVLEAAELSRMLEDKWGVSAAAPVAQVTMPTQGGPAHSAAEQQTEFNVTLKGYPPDKKIAVIKEVRAITGLGLKEAKELVEAAPKAVKEGVGKDEADKIKKTLEDAGAQIELT